jgi:regulatory protein
MIRRQTLTKEQALQKARHYCSYQERCHSEVKEKLYSLGLWKKEVEESLSTLIEEDYLNEQRFAIRFAGGRFRLKQWGKTRIRYEMKQKKVSDYCIQKALAAIDPEDYERTLGKLAAAKWTSLKGEKNIFNKKRKLQDYLLQKGYEGDLVSQAIRKMDEKNQ